MGRRGLHLDRSDYLVWGGSGRGYLCSVFVVHVEDETTGAGIPKVDGYGQFFFSFFFLDGGVLPFGCFAERFALSNEGHPTTSQHDYFSELSSRAEVTCPS